MPSPFRPLPLGATVLALALFSTVACSTTTGAPGDTGAASTADAPATDADRAGMPPPATTTSDAGGKHDMQTIAAGESFAMQPGDSVAFVDQSQLQYLRLVNDSRCQPGTQCIWEGDAEVAFRWQPDAGVAEEFSLHTSRRAGSNTRPIGTYTLTLESLDRGDAPQARLKLEATP